MKDRICWILGVVCIVLGTCGLAREHLDGLDLSGWWPAGQSAPFDSNGMAFLIVYDRKNVDALPLGQRDIINGTAIRAWGDTNCVKEHGSPAWRIWDAGTSLEGTDESDVWRKALAVPRDSLPWLVATNGRSGVSGPLPATEEETIKVLGRYAK